MEQTIRTFQSEEGGRSNSQKKYKLVIDLICLEFWKTYSQVSETLKKVYLQIYISTSIYIQTHNPNFCKQGK